MKFNVSYRKMESSPALRDYGAKKLKKIVNKYVKGPVKSSLVMTVEGVWHIANFTLHIKGLTVKGKERSKDMYSSIDLALEKIEKQLRRHRDRLNDYSPERNGKEQMFRMGVLSEQEYDVDEDFEEFEEFEEDYDLYPGPEEQEVEKETAAVVEREDDTVRVLRNREYRAKPMSIEEATLQLDLLTDREFFVFSNVESENLSIVYERDDGNVGLIET